MTKPPTGHVTFLFTDIEGSTKLAQQFPDLLHSALEKHHKILREAIESNNGFVFKIIDDAFCAAFENTNDAVKASNDAQINLNSEKWDEVNIIVRMGIHSGNVEWNGKDYMGYITLARTQRVMSAAYGGQVLISEDAYIQLTEKEKIEISYRDLGNRRLKDLMQPVKIYQLISKGLPSDFPPLKTLDARPNNLPVQLTSFIGREEEIKKVKELLKITHLLTLTGPGGAGKTRLALQVGADVIDDFANGVWFIELAPIMDPVMLSQE
ncbi:adenylate/guanylate cyclase domain-containing protein, partial [Bacteroidota bacterium]